jgi:hypothetical protein
MPHQTLYPTDCFPPLELLAELQEACKPGPGVVDGNRLMELAIEAAYRLKISSNNNKTTRSQLGAVANLFTSPSIKLSEADKGAFMEAMPDYMDSHFIDRNDDLDPISFCEDSYRGEPLDCLKLLYECQDGDWLEVSVAFKCDREVDDKEVVSYVVSYHVTFEDAKYH